MNTYEEYFKCIMCNNTGLRNDKLCFFCNGFGMLYHVEWWDIEGNQHGTLKKLTHHDRIDDKLPINDILKTNFVEMIN